MAAALMEGDDRVAPLQAQAQAWRAPAFQVNSLQGGRNMPADLQGGELRVWREAEVAGRAAGLAAAQKEMDERLRKLDATAAALDAALGSLDRPLARVGDDMHEQVARLAMAIARALIRRELRIDPAQVIGLVRETVGLLPGSVRGVQVLLHPEDAALVREKLAGPGPDVAWTIVEDPILSRGDCRVQTDHAQIDARIESRLHEALVALLGDDRMQQRNRDDG
jgi:flagellar assembly protein FliH